MKVRDIMSRSIESVGPTESIAEAAALMAERDVGALPVIDDGRLVGIVTDRDLAVRALAHNFHGGAPVFRVMTEKVASCSPESDVADALHVMAEEQVRRIPVCADDGSLLGIVSLGDAACQAEYCGEASETLRAVIRPRGRRCQASQPALLAV